MSNLALVGPPEHLKHQPQGSRFFDICDCGRALQCLTQCGPDMLPDALKVMRAPRADLPGLFKNGIHRAYLYTQRTNCSAVIRQGDSFKGRRDMLEGSNPLLHSIKRNSDNFCRNFYRRTLWLSQ